MIDIGDPPNGISMFFDSANLLGSDMTESEKSFLGVTENSNTVANVFRIAVTGEGIKTSKDAKRTIAHVLEENQINVEQLRKKNIYSILQRLDITLFLICGRFLLD